MRIRILYKMFLTNIKLLRENSGNRGLCVCLTLSCMHFEGDGTWLCVFISLLPNFGNNRLLVMMISF